MSDEEYNQWKVDQLEAAGKGIVDGMEALVVILPVAAITLIAILAGVVWALNRWISRNTYRPDDTPSTKTTAMGTRRE